MSDDGKDDDVVSVGSEVLPIEETAVNPEGYGIEGDFVPVAVFDVDASGDEDIGTTEDGGSPDEGTDEQIMDENEEEGGGEDEGEEMRTEGSEESEEEHLGEEGSEEEESAEGEELKEGKAEEVAIEGEEHKEEEEGISPTTGEISRVKKKIKKEPIKRRMTIRKKSVFYSMQARIREMDEGRVSGDFAAAETNYIGTSGSPPSITSFEPESGESLDEESIEEEAGVPINREYFYNIYKQLTPTRLTQRLKNNFLHRKMADYFRKRKMEHVLKETDQQIDSEQKYNKKLDALGDLRDLDRRERDSITAELNDMRTQRDDHGSMLQVHFVAMQNREKEIGSGLINSKTGKEIPDKVVERFLKRQKVKWEQVASMRLYYIKIRDRVGEKKVALHALDCIGENLHLIDYEQLKIENTSHTDKIEERDEELTKLRIKCRGAMQCLAHIREKSAAVLLDTQQLTERYDDVEMDFMDCRERLNYFKQERDNYRLQAATLRDNSGLLSRPTLLQDMEHSLDEVKAMTNQLDRLKEENQKLSSSLKVIKKNIAVAPVKVEDAKPTVHVKMSTQRIYKGRPTLIYPTLPESDWSKSN